MLTGGRTYWEEFLQDSNYRDINQASVSDLIQYIDTHKPSSSQRNGAKEEVIKYILRRYRNTNLKVADVRNYVSYLFGENPEFVIEDPRLAAIQLEVNLARTEPEDVPIVQQPLLLLEDIQEIDEPTQQNIIDLTEQVSDEVINNTSEQAVRLVAAVVNTENPEEQKRKLFLLIFLISVLLSSETLNYYLLGIYTLSFLLYIFYKIATTHLKNA